MAWKFLNIGKANAEIERLEAALVAEQGKVATLTTENAGLKTALTENDSDAVQAAQAAQGETATANTKIVALEAAAATHATELAALKTNLTAKEAEVTQLKSTIANPAGEIETRAATKAAAITAGQGQPAIKVVPAADPAGAPAKPALKGFAKVQAAIAAQLAGPSAKA